MELIAAMERGKRLADFLNYKVFYNSRFFKVEHGDRADDSIVDKVGSLNDMIYRSVTERFENNEEYDDIKANFNKIFNLQQKNFISVAALLRRNNIKVQDEYLDYPLTRGMIKAMELYNFMRAKLKILGRDEIRVLHLSELPGGFYFALRYFCNKKDIRLHSVVHSLKHDEEKYPDAFKDSYGLEARGVLDYGVEHGDLTQRKEADYFIKNYPDRDLVTCDFGYQKWLSAKNIPQKYIDLYGNTIDIAANTLNSNGIFVLKLYLFFPSTLKIIYSLYLRFEDIYFYKPLMSRPHSSEIYVICHKPLKEIKTRRMKTGQFLTRCYPFLKDVAYKILSLYKLFEYLAKYVPDEADEKAVKRFKFGLSQVILKLFI